MFLKVKVKKFAIKLNWNQTFSEDFPAFDFLRYQLWITSHLQPTLQQSQLLPPEPRVFNAPTSNHNAKHFRPSSINSTSTSSTRCSEGVRELAKGLHSTASVPPDSSCPDNETNVC